MRLLQCHCQELRLSGQTETLFWRPAGTLARTLDVHGFKLSRLKTGTPPRIDARTVNFNGMECQPTDEDPIPFSFLNMSNSAWTPPAQQAS